MNDRWLNILKNRLPTIDLIDISDEIHPFNAQKRQFAPEHSQTSYITMLKQEFAIGDYMEDPSDTLKITHYGRLTTIMLIQELCMFKKYKIETYS